MYCLQCRGQNTHPYDLCTLFCEFEREERSEQILDHIVVLTLLEKAKVPMLLFMII